MYISKVTFLKAPVVANVHKFKLVSVSGYTSVYLNRLLLLENRREVRQDEANIFVLGALFSNQQHVGKHKGNHVRIDELRGQSWQDAIYNHSLKRRHNRIGKR